jgi:hypothetical protein
MTSRVRVLAAHLTVADWVLAAPAVTLQHDQPDAAMVDTQTAGVR